MDQTRAITNCQIRTPRFDTDHYALVGGLRLSSSQQHQRYTQGRARFPLAKLKPEEMNPADVEMAELRKEVEKKPKTDGRDSSWILEATWRLIDQKADARSWGRQSLLGHLTKQVVKAL